MKTVIATEFKLVIYNDKLYFKTQFSTIVKRYYNSFGQLYFICRVIHSKKIDFSYEDVTEMISGYFSVDSLGKVMLYGYQRKFTNILSQYDLLIARVPSIIAYRVADCAKDMGIPYLTELMGDAWDSYWNHGIIGKIIAPYMECKMKSIVWKASYAIYVTNEYLQKKYPCKSSSIAASNVLIDLNGVNKFDQNKRFERIRKINKSDVVLMTTASVNVKHKGQQYVIKAIPLLNKKGIHVTYILAGDGDNTYLKKMAKKCNVENQVDFVGRLSLDDVLLALDETDIYIQPSLQEGLPRAMIEALSRGCIAIGARTAGIPELIDKEFVVNRKDPCDIAKKIQYICEQSMYKNCKVSRQNFEKAKEFDRSLLDKRRSTYFQQIINDIDESK